MFAVDLSCKRTLNPRWLLIIVHHWTTVKSWPAFHTRLSEVGYDQRSTFALQLRDARQRMRDDDIRWDQFPPLTARNRTRTDRSAPNVIRDATCTRLIGLIRSFKMSTSSVRLFSLLISIFCVVRLTDNLRTYVAQTAGKQTVTNLLALNETVYRERKSFGTNFVYYWKLSLSSELRCFHLFSTNCRFFNANLEDCRCGTVCHLSCGDPNCHMDNLGVHLRHFYLGSRVTGAVWLLLTAPYKNTYLLTYLLTYLHGKKFKMFRSNIVGEG